MRKLLLGLFSILLVSCGKDVLRKTYFVEIEKEWNDPLLGRDIDVKIEEIKADNDIGAYYQAYKSYKISSAVSEGFKEGSLNSNILGFRLLDQNQKNITDLIPTKSKDSIHALVDEATKEIGGRIKKQADNQKLKNEKKIDSVEFQRMKKLVSLDKDEFKEGLFYLQKNHPKTRNSNFMGFYFNGTEKSAGPLHFLVQYKDDDWLFIKSVQIKFDDKDVVTFYPTENERKVISGGILEWSDDVVYMDDELVSKYRTAKKIKYRLNGDQFYKEFTLTQKQIKHSQNLLDLYFLMK